MENNPQDEKEKIGSLVERLRSYEGDIARLKGISLNPQAKPEKEVASEPAHMPFEIVWKSEPKISNPGASFKSIEAANVVLPPEKPKEDPKIAIEALHHAPPPIPESRTIQTDIADNPKPKETSIADIVRAEEEKNRIRPREVADPKRGIYILGLSAALIVTGLIGIGVFYMIKTRPEPVPTVIMNPNVIIETKSSRDLVLAGNQPLPSALAALVKKEPAGAQGEIIGINVKEGTSTPVSAGRFAALFSNTIPTWLVRSFKPEYMVGMYSNNNVWQPFMIFKLASYDNAYSGMLKWEETMQSDFSGFIIPSADTSSSTPFINPVIKTGFRDVIIKNKDIRALQDGSGRRLILYSFTDKETLVITTSQAALEAIFAKLTTLKFVQ